MFAETVTKYSKTHSFVLLMLVIFKMSAHPTTHLVLKKEIDNTKNEKLRERSNAL